jgi:thymidylate synthase
MSHLEPTYKLRKTWGHTVTLVKSTADNHPWDKIEEAIQWAKENAQSRRISYDTWQFHTKEEAEKFIMMFKLQWGV